MVVTVTIEQPHLSFITRHERAVIGDSPMDYLRDNTKLIDENGFYSIRQSVLYHSIYPVVKGVCNGA